MVWVARLCVLFVFLFTPTKSKTQQFPPFRDIVMHCSLGMLVIRSTLPLCELCIVIPACLVPSVDAVNPGDKAHLSCVRDFMDFATVAQDLAINMPQA